MKTYYIQVDCNGGEYVNHTTIKCKKLTRVIGSNNAVKADNVLIEFDEDILDIAEIKELKK